MDRYSNEINKAIMRSKRGSYSLAVYIDHKPFEQETRVDIINNDNYDKGVEITPVHIRLENNELVVTSHLNYKTAKIREEKLKKEAEQRAMSATNEQERVQLATKQFQLQEELKNNFSFSNLDWTLDELEQYAVKEGSFLNTLLNFNLVSDEDLTNPVLQQLNRVAKVENLPEVNGISFSTELYILAEQVYRGSDDLIINNPTLNKVLALTLSNGLTVRKVLAKGFEIHNFLINTELAQKYDIQGFKNYERRDNQNLSRLELFTDFIPFAIKFSMIPNLMLESLEELEKQMIQMKGESDEPYVKIMKNSIRVPNLTKDGKSISSYSLSKEEEGYTLFTTKLDVMDILKINMPTYPLTLVMNSIYMAVDNGSDFIRKGNKLVHDPFNNRYLTTNAKVLEKDNIAKNVSYELSIQEYIIYEAIKEAQFKLTKKKKEILATQKGVMEVVRNLSIQIANINSMDLVEI